MCLLDTVSPAENSETMAEAAIPGLDFSDDKTSGVVDVQHSVPDTRVVVARRKPIYTKPVPKAFERAWAEGRETMVQGSSQSSRLNEFSIGLLGESPGQHCIATFCCPHPFLVFNSLCNN